MSLHLIESTKLQSVANRKRGGTTASVVLHSTLIVGVFTVASATPAPDENPKTQTVVYVAPTPPPIAKQLQASLKTASGAPARTPEFVMPRMPDLFNISIDIPTVSTDIVIDQSLRDFSAPRGGSTSTGMGTGSGGSTALADASAILSDLQVEKPVVALSGYRTPRYPEAMRAMGVEETLNAMFVVDTLGRIESGSLEIRDAQHPQFIQAVRDALANARFRPAEVQGHRVRQRVMQSFVFSLARD